MYNSGLLHALSRRRRVRLCDDEVEAIQYTHITITQIYGYSSVISSSTKLLNPPFPPGMAGFAVLYPYL